MSRMIAYGFWKSWRTRRLFLLVCVAAAVLLIPAVKLSLAMRWNGVLGFCYPVLAVIGIMLLVAPLIWGIVDFGHGIAGRRAVLERSVSLPAWQKLLARLIVSTVTIVVLGAVGIGLFAGTAAVTVSGYSTLRDIWQEFVQDPGYAPLAGFLIRGGMLGFAGWVFQTVKILLLFYFAIALAKSFSGRRKAGVLAIILFFAAYSVLSSLLSELARRVPLATFVLYAAPEKLMTSVFSGVNSARMTLSLTSVLINVVVTVLAFCGTAWLTEHRVEN